jgi:ferredoxin
MRMQPTRRVIQFGFLALVVGGVFVLGANAERWCPFGGVEALYEYATEGTMLCSLGVSNFYVLAGVLVMTLLLRRAFCGYLCPIGAISEWLRRGAGAVGIRQWRVPPTVDRVLSAGKYVVLAAILGLTWWYRELIFRAFDPCYALISRHGTDITVWAYVVVGAIVVASLLVMLPFCRWLCPLAAVLNPFSAAGLARVRRNAEACTDCGRCGRECPMDIPVDRLPQVRQARCTACLSCVDACPQHGRGALSWGPPASLGSTWPRAVLVGVILLCVTGAVAAAYLVPLPSYVKTRGQPPAETDVVELRVANLSCRGRANLLYWFLDRNDMFQLTGPDGEPGYFRLEAWPGDEWSRVRVTFDATEASADDVRRAITEPYFNLQDDAESSRWMESPFTIQGYDPLAAPLDDLPPL